MSGYLKAIILGCGSSGGVPRVGGDWGACDPNEPRNRRSRCSLWVEYCEADRDEPTSILIDTSPDLRQQLLGIQVKRLDAVLFTHEHADQTHGIDDLRALAYRMRHRIPTYMDAHARDHILEKFGYCFEMPDGRVHPPILEIADVISPGDTLVIDGPGGALSIDVLGLSHGPTTALGFLFEGKLAYTPDVHDINDDVLAKLEDIPVWIVDALRYSQHPTHAHVDKTLMWLAKTRTRQGIFTNMHIDMDYGVLSSELPPAHIAAFDGMEVNFDL